MTNAEALAPFFEKSRTGRIDVIGLGDSNQAFGGTGWDHGWIRALSNEFTLYATGLFAPGENQGNGSGLGWSYQSFSTASANIFAYSGSTLFHQQLLAGSLHPLYPLRLNEGVAAGGFMNQGMFLEAGSPLNVNAALRFHATVGIFEGEGPGSFRLSSRLQQPPYSLIANGPTLSTRGSTDTLQHASLDLAPGVRNSSIGFRFSPWGTDMVGPFIAYTMRIENLERSRGSSFHTLYANGGQSARDMAFALQTAPDAELTMLLSQVRALQDEPRRILVRINTGLNDRNENLPSRGPLALTDASSPEAFGDNIDAIMTRFQEIWSLNGWDESELFFLISVSHAVSVPDDPKLLAYRAVASAIALSTPRTAALDFEKLANANFMLASGWYQAGGNDRNHLTTAAFETLARWELEALTENPCPGDANGDGQLTFADITLILERFQQCAPRRGLGDANNDRIVDFADITTLLADFGAVCND